jgi:CubicO group peptidase (beta-lactamase class C family)
MKYSVLVFLICIRALFQAQELPVLKIDEIFLPLIKSNDSPGFAVGIVREGELVYGLFGGMANLNTRELISDTTIFSVASMAKQFTASCIYFLMKEGKIELNDKVRKHIPELPVLYEDVTIQHMLNQTSGMREYHALLDMAGFDYDVKYYDNQTVLDLMCKQQKLNHAPGTKVVYGNSAYTLLATIVERITELDFGYYATTRIFDPLGMTQTFFRTTDEVNIKDKAVGYVVNDNKTYTTFSSIQRSYGAGSLGTSLQDMVLWSNVINGLNADYIPLRDFLIHQEQIGHVDFLEYANGLMVDEYRGFRTVHHSGVASGFRSNMISIPEQELSVIIFANFDRINPTTLSYRVLDILLPQEKISSDIEVTMTTEDIGALVGYYREIGSDMEIELSLENDSLRSRGSQSKQKIALIPSANWEFKRANSLNVRYKFTSNGSDMVIYFGATPFYFSRVSKELPSHTKMRRFTGNYYSSELDCSYQISIENGVLYVHFPERDKQALNQIGTDLFGNGQRSLFRFIRNKVGKVIALEVSYEGTVMDIRFDRKKSTSS